MARGSRRGSADASDIANAELEALLSPPTMTPLLPLAPFDLGLLEDRREFHPEGAFRPPLSFDRLTEIDVYEPEKRGQHSRIGGRVARTRPYGRTAQTSSRLSEKVAFRDGDRVAICVRRKRRKEVLHALRKTGRGSRRPRRYNRYSQVRC